MKLNKTLAHKLIPEMRELFKQYILNRQQVSTELEKIKKKLTKAKKIRLKSYFKVIEGDSTNIETRKA